jgi:hypothetical protein
MGNYLKMSDKQRILVLLDLGWTYRRVERETGVRRKTVARDDARRQAKAANLSIGFDESANEGLDLLLHASEFAAGSIGRGRCSTMSAAAEPGQPQQGFHLRRLRLSGRPRHARDAHAAGHRRTVELRRVPALFWSRMKPSGASTKRSVCAYDAGRSTRPRRSRRST